MDQYGFMKDLNGLKAQVAKWKSVGEAFNASIPDDRADERIPTLGTIFSQIVVPVSFTEVLMVHSGTPVLFQ